MAELRDPYTAAHERRGAALARDIGVELGMSSDDVEGLHVMGLVHDIGKVTVPVEILSYPGRLNSAQFALVQHSQYGYDLLRSIRLPWPVADVVLQHHERLDGSGYPLGLRGDAICRQARILAVADVVEAMSSHRPYRAALAVDVALAELQKNAHVLYDRDVVVACVALFRQHGYAFE